MEIKSIDPVPALPDDIVGYTPLGFVILNAADWADRGMKSHLGRLPLCTVCMIKNNQTIRFSSGKNATLHDINGDWYFKFAEPLKGEVTSLAMGCFFEIVDK